MGLVAGLLTYGSSQADVRVTGTVQLSVLAGNEFDFLLNAYAADFDAALGSAEVQQALDAAPGVSGAVRGLRSERTGESSRVTVALTAEQAEVGSRALLVAARAALREMARAQEVQLLRREDVARASLQARLAAGERLAEQPPEDRFEPLLEERLRAVDRALIALSAVQEELAVVRQVRTQEPTPGVTIEQVAPRRETGRALRALVSATAAAALLGALLLYARDGRRRHRPGRAQDSDEPAREASLAPATPWGARRGPPTASPALPPPGA